NLLFSLTFFITNTLSCENNRYVPTITIEITGTILFTSSNSVTVTALQYATTNNRTHNMANIGDDFGSGFGFCVPLSNFITLSSLTKKYIKYEVNIDNSVKYKIITPIDFTGI